MCPAHAKANCFVKSPAVVALYGGLPDCDKSNAEMREAVEVAVRAQQNNDTAVELAWAAARVLERVIVTVGLGFGKRMSRFSENHPSCTAEALLDARLVE